MANDKPESGTDNPGESLSATGMFLRAFGEKPKAESAPADALFGAPMQQQPQPAPPKQAPGEFTQLFQSLEAKPIAPSAAAAQPVSVVAPAEPQARLGTAPVKTPPQTAAEQAGAPGEFTKLFVGGTSAAPPAVRRSTEESVKPAPPAQSSSRGFSAPGVSGSASGEGSFTQIFSTPQAKTSSPPSEAQPANPAAKAGWNSDPIFPSPQGPPPSEPASPSVTTLLASLGTAGGSPAGRAPEPAPYRPEPSPRSAPLISHEPPEVGAGGVTRLIQRLAQTPVEAAPAPTPAAAPPVNTGPGEFTRIISRQNASAAEPPVAAPPAPAPAGFGFPAAPPTPAFAPPAAPPAPRLAPPAPAVPMPVPPKPPAVAAPAVAPAKTKLEAMVPILLVINTFLLLILLVVVIFLVKSR